jgi:hypothetical protein
MPIDGMYGCVMTDAAVELIRRDERERIVRLIEACKFGTPDSPYVDEDIIRGLEWAIAAVREENAD